jgi:NADPH:quinone reductase
MTVARLSGRGAGGFRRAPYGVIEGQSTSVLVKVRAPPAGGTAAVQLARLVEGTYVIGAASAAKHPYLRAQGVQQVIDYRTQDWADQVRAAHPDGVDIVLDSVGEDSFPRSIGLLR